MKIGTCITFADIETMEESIAKLKRNGFDSCQIISWTPAIWTDENAQKLSALIEKYGIAADRIIAQGEGISNMFVVNEWNRVSICTIEE